MTRCPQNLGPLGSKHTSAPLIWVNDNEVWRLPLPFGFVRFDALSYASALSMLAAMMLSWSM